MAIKLPWKGKNGTLHQDVGEDEEGTETSAVCVHRAGRSEMASDDKSDE